MVAPGHQVLSCGSSGARALRGVTRMHSHPGSELICLHAGVAVVCAGGTEFLLRAGSILRIPAGCRHDQRNRSAVRQTYIISDASGPERPELVQTDGDEPVVGWMRDLAHLHLAPGGAGTSGGALLAAIHARLDQLAGHAAAQRNLPPPLAALVRHCETEPLDDRDEAGMARIAGVSPAHLRALCRAHLGVPPGEFRRNLRLQLAQKLLRSSYLDISAVAAACGWADANYFARLFRSRTGLSPRSFRRQYRA
jgi:AraC-like DNA-binding protein